MRKILRPPELVDDSWTYFSADTGGEAGAGDLGLIVPLADLLADPARWQARSQAKKLGVRVKPADRVEDLAPHLPAVSLVAIEFPAAGEGRGYSFARLLRQRYGFKGEVRAVGPAVKQDLLHHMARTGFDAFELAPGQDLESALKGLARYSLAYQAAVPVEHVQTPRFNARSA